MAQPATNPKIEELRIKLKADPKSRLFYQLAEELRRAGQFDESEKVLRTGLSAYPTYLAAWVSFGRVLREQKDDAGAVDALNKALLLDPGNVVAARLLADSYLALGDRIEAIKKYKLVHALLPSDETLEVQIAAIQRELDGPVAVAQLEESTPEVAAVPAPAPAPDFEESPFDKTIPPFANAPRVLGEQVGIADETGDSEPMAFAHQESPFEEPVTGFGEAAFGVEAPAGIHFTDSEAPSEELPAVQEEAPAPVEAAPAPAEAARAPVEAAPPVEDIPPQAPVSELLETPFDDTEPDASVLPGDAADTITMADLYSKQGLIEDARHIYENILSRDPDNAGVRAKLEDLSPRVNPKIAKLEGWLARVSKREVGRV